MPAVLREARFVELVRRKSGTVRRKACFFTDRSLPRSATASQPPQCSYDVLVTLRARLGRKKHKNGRKKQEGREPFHHMSLPARFFRRMCD